MIRLPPRPTLRRGLRVTRRDDRHLQIGIDPPLRAVVPDTPAVRRLLTGLRDARPPDVLTDESAAALLTLLDHDLLVDAEGPEPEQTHFGASARERMARRSAGWVGVVVSSPSLEREALQLLEQAGVAAGPGAPAVWLVPTEGEPARAAVDDLVRDGAPHLLVSSRTARLEVGPFVEPGRTACLRCVDAHRAVADPRRHLVVEQVARAASNGGNEPHDPTLWHLALAWAVRDLCRYLEGDRPSTWSATVEVGPVAVPEPTTWARHPHCGCAWDQAVG